MNALRAHLVDYAIETETPLLFADGFDDAIIGLGRQFNTVAVVYDTDLVLGILISQGMTADEALEHFEFNIVGAYVGEHTPIFIERRPQ